MIDLNGKSVLVTGGCGFIGSNFIEYINDNYKKVDIYNIDKWGVGHRKLTGSIRGVACDPKPAYPLALPFPEVSW